MAYDPEFYRRYQAYLKESAVAEAHHFAIQAAKATGVFNSVLDLGCGQCCEFQNRAYPMTYIGIDQNPPLKEQPKRFSLHVPSSLVMQGDYRIMDLPDLHKRFLFTAIVSLFSTECTAPCTENYKFYEALFENMPINSALVSGFYYASKADQETVQETGGITSYQSIETIDSVVSEMFTEKRIVMAVPSKMFGQDVFEVWKLLERR